MVGMSSGGVATAAAGAFVTPLGYLIKFRGWTFLVAGYDDSASVPGDVVADAAGSTVLRVGLATIGYGLVVGFAEPSDLVGLLFAAAVLLAVGRLIYRLNTYERRAGA